MPSVQVRQPFLARRLALVLVVDPRVLDDVGCLTVPFTQWVQRVNTEEGFAVESVLIQNIDYFGPRVG